MEYTVNENGLESWNCIYIHTIKNRHQIPSFLKILCMYQMIISRANNIYKIRYSKKIMFCKNNYFIIKCCWEFSERRKLKIIYI